MHEVASTHSAEEQEIWSALKCVFDPEIPVLSIIDLGIARRVIVHQPLTSVEVEITPTYSGCPAMDMISFAIKATLLAKGYANVKVTPVLSPAWTTDWMNEASKKKLKAYGIAPPGEHVRGNWLFKEPAPVQCPLCNSFNTAIISEFGSTSCKSLYRCLDCKEPFDVFKCH